MHTVHELVVAWAWLGVSLFLVAGAIVLLRR